jgi:light-harvesting complex 1 alpha chain
MHRVWLWVHPIQFLTALYIFLGVLAFGIHFILLSTERYNWLAGPASRSHTPMKRSDIYVPSPTQDNLKVRVNFG